MDVQSLVPPISPNTSMTVAPTLSATLGTICGKKELMTVWNGWAGSRVGG